MRTRSPASADAEPDAPADRTARPPGARPHVVIVGAGFGGLWAARHLARLPMEVTVVDRQNYHTFLPLLYQVAAAELEPEQIAYPIRSILRRHRNVGFLLAEVRSVDPEARLVRTDGPDLTYDYLILATGSVEHFFGMGGAQEWAYPLKTVDQAIALRNQILRCFERAAHGVGPEEERELLTFAIVGGGPTGVEFAGALAELIQGPFLRDYPGLDLQRVQVLLLEAMDTLLPGWPERLGRYAERRLAQMGVQVRTGSMVSGLEERLLHLQDGSRIPTRTVVWTAGVRGQPVGATSGLPTDKGGRVELHATLQVSGRPRIYVVGDLAGVRGEADPLPMIAPVAMQQGTHAARSIGRQLEGREPQPFRYRDKGMLVTIGRNAGAAHVSGRQFSGLPAWLLWLGVHLFNLIGFRNRLIVLINWSWDYFLFERVARLILPSQLPRRPSGRGAPEPHPSRREEPAGPASGGPSG